MKILGPNPGTKTWRAPSFHRVGNVVCPVFVCTVLFFYVFFFWKKVFFVHFFLCSFFCKFGALVVDRSGLEIPRSRDCKSRRSKNSAAATSRKRCVNIINCRTRNGRASRAAASPSSRTNAQFRIARGRSAFRFFRFEF